ncbi:MAG: pseudouridine synthase [Candidatus Riflebacteria bacterium]|nr:pseudouridine synthase [Candidatus Riflebacteria bacterium]
MLSLKDILYRDDSLVIICKPAGLLVHPSYIDKSETESAMKQLRDLIGQWVYPVHRLDKATSGVLVFALSSDSAKLVADAFAGREVTKTYLALVRGYTREAEIIDYPLKDIWDKTTDRAKSRNNPAKEAITEYARLATTELPVAVRPHPSARYSLLRVTPHTGRNRQIRRHMKHIFHHLIGDHRYGDGHHNQMLSEQYDCNRMMLHAHTITFKHPVNGQTMTITAPLPADFTDVLDRIGINTQLTE